MLTQPTSMNFFLKKNMSLPESSPLSSMERSNGDESQIPTPNHPKLPTQLPKQHLQQPRTPPPQGAARCGISANTCRARTAAQQHHARENQQKRRGVPGSPRRRQLGGSAKAAEQQRLEDARCQHGRGPGARWWGVPE